MALKIVEWFLWGFFMGAGWFLSNWILSWLLYRSPRGTQ